jgi:hypothetical protein
LAFKAKRFTLNPVYVSTETIYTLVIAGLFFATTDLDDGPPFCSTVPSFYFTTATTNAILIEAWKTTIMPPPRIVTYTEVNGTATLTRLIPYCFSTTSSAATAI